MAKKNKSKKKAEAAAPAAAAAPVAAAEAATEAPVSSTEASPAPEETGPIPTTNGSDTKDTEAEAATVSSLREQLEAAQNELQTQTKRLQVEKDVAVKRLEQQLAERATETEATQNGDTESAEAEHERQLQQSSKELLLEQQEHEKTRGLLLEAQQATTEALKRQNEASGPAETAAASGPSADEVEELREQLQKVTLEKSEKEEQYDTLLGRITQIKSTLGERLKSDAAELEELRGELAEARGALEQEKSAVKTLKSELVGASDESSKLSAELASFRRKFNSEVENLSRERDLLKRENLVVQEQLNKSQGTTSRYEIALGESNTLVVDLEARNQSLQDELKHLQTLVASSQQEKSEILDKLNALKKQGESSSSEQSTKIQEIEAERQALEEQLQTVKQGLEAASETQKQQEEKIAHLATFEKDARDKSLQIGKLRHEAVILNEHLTNALQMIKKSSEGDTVDKQLVSNLILSFVGLSRGDTKKFEVLQLISNFLGWDEQEKVQAGLSRSTFMDQSNLERSGSGTNLMGAGADKSGGGAVGFFGKFAEFLDREASKK